VTLKSYEYWIRMMRASKSMPDADDCIAIFTKEAASRVLKDLSEHFEKLNAEEDCITGAARKRFVKEVNGSYAGKRLRCDEDNEEMSVAYQRRQMAVVRFNDVIDRSCSVKEIADFVRNYLCGEGIFDTSSQKVFYESVARELEKVLEENCSVDDGYFRRLNIVQNAFNLSDAEMEIVLFSWIFFNKEQCSSLLDMIGSRRFRGAALPDVFPQLYPDVDFENLVSNKGTLKQMGILDEDLDISKRIGMFLDGHSGNDLDSLYFRVYEGGCVPYKKLCRKDPKVEMAFDMIKHAKVGEGLNIFFYGVEGTGKTELAKAIAKELKRPLVLTNISTEGVHRDSKENSVVRSRMGSILYAATKYQKKKAILLVDESDVILNCCEKGALNFFLEQIKIPVIWISNNIGYIENSTLRRFDYSIRFERLDAEKREQVWQSVVSEQGAGAIISEEELKRFASEFQITAGGITQAIAGTKKLLESGCKVDPLESIRTIAEAQANLLNLDMEYASRDKESRAPRYLLDAINTDADMPKILKVMSAFDAKWKDMQKGDRADSLNMLLYGAPGTGKTEFAKHIARILDRKLIIKKASDLLNCYVGETEKAIRKMFKEAEEKKAILFLDEADSMIRDRSGAARNWEVTQVNEMLTQMENFKGIFIAATNFEGELDTASRRRFALKVKFGYLKPEGIEALWKGFFPKVEMPEAVRSLRMLTPGDFNAAYASLRFYDESELTAEAVLNALKSELAYKDSREGRTMGL
jgi:SpoVK/Ycf46/Vps4 family AAA+-type ATPase